MSGRPKELVVNLRDESDRRGDRSEQARVFPQLKPRVKKGKKYVAEYLSRAERDEAPDRCEMKYCENESDIDDIESTSTDSETDIKNVFAEKLKKIKREFYKDTPRESPYLIINEYKRQILFFLANYQAIILTGPTGCGKSTQVPLFVLDSCMEKDEYCNIVVTQPRRIAATSVTKRVCNVRDWVLGSICGFKVGLVDRTSHQTLLTYMTTGVLLQTLIKRKSLSQYTHIIIDEIHERDQSMDMLLIVIKKLIKLQYSNVKIILMSATAEAEKFSRYFSTKSDNELIPAPILTIDGPTSYTIDIFYLNDLPFVENDFGCENKRKKLQPRFLTTHLFRIKVRVGNGKKETNENCLNCVECKTSKFPSEIVYITLTNVTMPKLDPQNAYIPEATYDICIRLIKSFEELRENEQEKGSVLVFLPGINEIEHLYYKLRDVNVMGDGGHKWHILTLHSSISTEDHSGIFRPAKPGYRKIIISTNLAESSVTVPGVKYVIDFCVVKRLKCDPTKNVHGLQLCWASQSNCVQRAGRTGRVMDGKVYRMVSKEFYETLDKESPSELSGSPLDKIILQIKVFDMGEPLAILAHALDPPDLSDIEWSILILKETGALLRRYRGVYTPHDGELTFLGRLMAALPVDMHIAKLIAMGHIFGFLTECIIMGAAMSVKNVFANPFSDRLKAYDMKFDWAENSFSDCIAFLNVFQIWTRYHQDRRFAGLSRESDVSNWASSNFVHLHVLGEIDALVREIRVRLKEFQIEEPLSRPCTVNNDFDRVLLLKVALAGAFYPYYFSTGFRYGNTYEKRATTELEGRNPFRTVVLESLPRKQPSKTNYDLIRSYLKNIGRAARLSSKSTTQMYIEFRNREPRMRLHGEDGFDEIAPTEILREVYRAVKVGKITKNTHIKLLSEDEAEREEDQVGVSNWNFLGPEYKPTTPDYIPCPLPDISVSRINITISHIVNPGHFWALYSDNLQYPEIILSTIMKRYHDLDPYENTPVPGRMCIAPMRIGGETRFNRARIENVDLEAPHPYADVFFVDHGSFSSIDISDLRQYDPLVKDLEKIPGQAFECVLTEVRPSSLKCVKGVWTRASLSAFQSIIEGGELYGNIYSVVNGVVSLELHKTNGEGNDININKYLIDEMYGEEAEESRFSKLNHSVRAESLLDEDQKLYFNKLQEGKFWGLYPEFNVLELLPLPESNRRLRGPKSPLEMKLYPCPRVLSSKNVVISEESMNSVLLCTDPADRHDRLVVAGHICQNAGSSSLLINNVTVMPNIHGLAALIPIMFCPEAEFRLNKEKTKLTGVLCGLGSDHHGDSFFPDHDIEIQFDSEITPNDIVVVNSLRYYMNQLLKANDYQKYWTIVKQQSTARNIALMLLKNKRLSAGIDLRGVDYRWKRISSTVCLHGKTKKSDSMWPYPMHATPFIYGDFY